MSNGSEFGSVVRTRIFRKYSRLIRQLLKVGTMSFELATDSGMLNPTVIDVNGVEGSLVSLGSSTDSHSCWRLTANSTGFRLLKKYWTSV